MMSDMHVVMTTDMGIPSHISAIGGDVLSTVMAVLVGIRPLQSNGLEYGESSNLTDAGFTSVEMVKVMLGVEAAFDLMIPQDMITPENFTSGSAIAAMMAALTKSS